jgi:hypothetical protein
MPKPNGRKPPFEVHASVAIRKILLNLQRQAAREGRGDQVLAAFKEIVKRLQQDPQGLGEPSYSLSALRLQIRTCSVRPLVVDFGVHLDRPLVFIKGVRLLSE